MASVSTTPAQSLATFSFATLSATSLSPSFPKPSQLFATRTTRSRNTKSRSFSCTSSKNDHDQGHQSRTTRRDIIIGVGGISTSSIFNDASTDANRPIPAPDPSHCDSSVENCCPPVPHRPIKDFTPPPVDNPRVRRAAQFLDDTYIEKYSKAIDEMKKLPKDDPRNFMQQANVHCAYCNGVYEQAGYPGLELLVHSNWLFFPFHRYYLYFYEKILGHLIEDPTFALPFWNWDSPAGMQIPNMYTNKNLCLYDPHRDQTHQPPILVNYGSDICREDYQIIISENLATMYRQMNVKCPSLFLGMPYRAGDEPNPGAGTIETNPHNFVHNWTGDQTRKHGEDMGTFYSAGRDPIFFAHHANVDRMWALWKEKGRKDFTDYDWLHSSFFFYDENAIPVRVKVRDALTTNALGYVYQKVETPWEKSKPTPRRPLKKKTEEEKAEEEEVPISKFPLILDELVRTIVERPKTLRSRKKKVEEEEVLVIYGIEFENSQAVQFDVIISEEQDVRTITPDYSEFAGKFVTVPHIHKDGKSFAGKKKIEHGKKITTCYRPVITSLLEDLQIEGDKNIPVFLVPRVGKGKVKIGGVKIELVKE